MEKVIVSKEVAEAIEFLKADDWSFSSVMNVLTSGGFSKVDEAVKLNTTPIETVAQAYLNGYEVAKTPAEIVKAKFLRQRDIHLDLYGDDLTETAEYAYAGGYIDAIKEFADAYGIRIEGVNA